MSTHAFTRLAVGLTALLVAPAAAAGRKCAERVPPAATRMPDGELVPVHVHHGRADVGDATALMGLFEFVNHTSTNFGTQLSLAVGWDFTRGQVAGDATFFPSLGAMLHGRDGEVGPAVRTAFVDGGALFTVGLQLAWTNQGPARGS
jgi:hypothetical protein